MTSEVLLVDWRTQKYILVELVDSSHLRDVGLIPGHVLHVVHSPQSTQPQLHIYYLDVFHALWLPLVNFDLTKHLTLVEYPHLVLPLPAPTSLIWYLQMKIHESPLRADTYKISICIWGQHNVVLRCTYAPSLGPSDGRVAVTGKPTSGRRILNFRRPSYAGYALDAKKQSVCRSAVDSDGADLDVVEMPEGCEWEHLFSASGVVTRLMSSAAVISYYR
ncbi:hypothetical protein B0H17DRAFT_103807 [Mycena rosella]|uniref:Uncharacterized protein n=1 Tax=Mycena rosella TaxID=1033263 RepID=A0AAD7GCP2_MYCRO|nr:hypothetical protein B0H17DRAFT_103807 [Mycena rosella]